MKLGGVGLGVEEQYHTKALPSQTVSLIGANPLKSVETPHLLVHNSFKQLWKWLELLRPLFLGFYDVQSKVHILVFPGFHLLLKCLCEPRGPIQSLAECLPRLDHMGTIQ